MARKERTAMWLFVAACAAATWLSLASVGTVVRVGAFAGASAALVWLAVRSIRLSRAWTVRALAQSAVEEADAKERITGRAS